MRCPRCGREIKEEYVKCPYCGYDLLGTSETFHTGFLLGDRYRIIREIGRGGMGVVYLAEDKELGIEVAIKVIREELGRDKRTVEELKREARITMTLSHPNIMRLYTFESSGEKKFLVMEYIDGATLNEILAERGRLEVEEVIEYGIQICEGLEYAHKRGVLHRDIKPGNIMITKEGEIKITDFGIARKLKDSYTRVTKQKETSGTLLYMSPEQIQGERIDNRGDIYSLGATLYELLSGNPPFYSGSIEYQIINVKPKPIEGIPEELNKIILKCLEKKKEDRYSSCEEIKRDLEKVKEGKRIEVRKEEVKKIEVKKKKSKKPVYFLLLLLLLGISIFAGITHKQKKKPLPPPSPPVVKKEEIKPEEKIAKVEKKKEEEKKIEEQKRRKQTEEYIKKAEGYYRKGEYEKALKQYTLALKYTTDNKNIEKRIEEVIKKIGEKKKEEKKKEEKRPPLPKLTQIYYGSLYVKTEPEGAEVWIEGKKYGESPLLIEKIEAGKKKIEIKKKYYEPIEEEIEVKRDEVVNLKYTLKQSTGNLTVITKPIEAEVWIDNERKGITPTTIKEIPAGKHKIKIKKGEEYKEVEGEVEIERNKIKKLTFTLKEKPKGRLNIRGIEGVEVYINEKYIGKSPLSITLPVGLTLVKAGGDEKKIEIKEGEKTIILKPCWKNIATLEGHSYWVYCLTLSKDGRYLFSGGSDETIKVWEVGTWKNIATLEGHSVGVSCLTVSKDGKYLFSGGWDRTIKVWEVGSWKNIATLKGHNDYVECLTLSKDGRYLFSGGGYKDKTIKVWEVGRWKNIATLKGHSVGVSCLTVSKDGKYLFSGGWDGTIKVWEVGRWKNIATLKGHSRGVRCLTLSKDGRYLFSGSGDGTIKVWEVGSWKNIATLKGHSSSVYCLALSKDGRYLFSGSRDKTIKVWEAKIEIKEE